MSWNIKEEIEKRHSLYNNEAYLYVCLTGVLAEQSN